MSPAVEETPALFQHWESDSGGSRKTLVVAAVAVLFLGVLGGLYLLSLRKGGTVETSPKIDSGQTVVAAANPIASPTASPTATPAPIPSPIQETSPSETDAAAVNPTPPEKERNTDSVSSGDIRKLEKARRADKLGSFKQAAKYYNEYLKSRPTDADAALATESLEKLEKFTNYITAAKTAYRRRNFESARANYAAALKLRPYSKMVQSGLSRATSRRSGRSRSR